MARKISHHPHQISFGTGGLNIFGLPTPKIRSPPGHKYRSVDPEGPQLADGVALKYLLVAELFAKVRFLGLPTDLGKDLCRSFRLGNEHVIIPTVWGWFAFLRLLLKKLLDRFTHQVLALVVLASDINAVVEFVGGWDTALWVRAGDLEHERVPDLGNEEANTEMN